MIESQSRSGQPRGHQHTPGTMVQRFLLAIGVGTVLFAAPASAQATRGYVFAGPTLTGALVPANTSFGILPLPIPPVPPPPANFYAAGMGFERVANKHLGFGVDLSGILPGSGKILSNTLGTASANGYFHVCASCKFDFYGTAGYTLLFQNFTVNGLNSGGGLAYWWNDNHGVMLEARWVYLPGNVPANVASDYYTEIRLGYT